VVAPAERQVDLHPLQDQERDREVDEHVEPEE
jgi:hypothetical protein